MTSSMSSSVEDVKSLIFTSGKDRLTNLKKTVLSVRMMNDRSSDNDLVSEVKVCLPDETSYTDNLR